MKFIWYNIILGIFVNLVVAPFAYIFRKQAQKNKGFLWSTVEEANFKKGDKISNFPDYTSIKYFFDIFVDGSGTKSFETTPVEGSLMGDFWVKCITRKTKIYSEADVVGQMGEDNYDDYL